MPRVLFVNNWSGLLNGLVVNNAGFGYAVASLNLDPLVAVLADGYEYQKTFNNIEISKLSQSYACTLTRTLDA